MPSTRQDFAALLDHALPAAGATSNLLADPAREMLFRASRGLPRLASKLLRTAFRTAHERDQNFIDEHAMEAAIDLMAFSLAP